MKPEPGCLPLLVGAVIIAWLTLIGTVVTIEAVIGFARTVIAGGCA